MHFFLGALRVNSLHGSFLSSAVCFHYITSILMFQIIFKETYRINEVTLFNKTSLLMKTPKLSFIALDIEECCNRLFQCNHTCCLCDVNVM